MYLGVQITELEKIGADKCVERLKTIISRNNLAAPTRQTDKKQSAQQKAI
jgi:hypothetical protein